MPRPQASLIDQRIKEPRKYIGHVLDIDPIGKTLTVSIGPSVLHRVRMGTVQLSAIAGINAVANSTGVLTGASLVTAPTLAVGATVLLEQAGDEFVVVNVWSSSQRQG